MTIIEVDEFKKQIDNYDPEKSENFHSESGKLADKEFTKELKNSKYKNIILMAGGTASGKIEFAKTFLDRSDNLVYDGTLKNYNGFVIKQRNVKKFAKHKPVLKVVYIIPSDFEKSFEVFLSRKRKMNKGTFFETNIKSALTICYLLENKDCDVEIYTSDFNNKRDEMTYEQMKIKDEQKVVRLLKKTVGMLESKKKEFGIEI